MGPETLRTTLKVNDACPKTKYDILVTFGVRKTDNTGGCESQMNVTKDPLSPGETASFSVETDSVPLEHDKEYCYTVSVDGEKVYVLVYKSYHSFPVTSEERNDSVTKGSDGCSGRGHPSVGAAEGIAAVLSLLVVLAVGVVLGSCGTWCVIRSRGIKTNPQSASQKEELSRVIYEEPLAFSPVESVFSFSGNQAYGQLNTKPGST